MQRILYELKGRGDLRFSPYCWRALMALAHKGIAVERVPLNYTAMPEKLNPLGASAVPVLVDGDNAIADSWLIAQYLERTYPDRPSLFGGPVGEQFAAFVNRWADRGLHPTLMHVIAHDIYDNVDAVDQPYFKKTRETRLGKSLEYIRRDSQATAAGLTKILEPLRAQLAAQPFLSGAAPLYPDYVVFGTLQWSRCASTFPLLTADDVLWAWRGRMLDLYGGLGRNAAACDEVA
ncbi:MAG: glutathione S-transferase N-terminal domain-containing protein [Alphaproteobacteria bacterium]